MKWLDFEVKRSKVEVTARPNNGSKHTGRHILQSLVGISPNLHLLGAYGDIDKLTRF